MAQDAANSKAAGFDWRALSDGEGLPQLRWLIGNRWWDGFILLCIVVNAVVLGIDAQFGDNDPEHQTLEVWNLVFLGIFTIELLLEFLAHGWRRYVRDHWNLFDVAVVAVSYVAVNPAVSALRMLRVIRVFRLISAVPQMRRVVEALLTATPGILATFAILTVVFYIGAVMATTLFHGERGFEDLGQSALSLFALSQFDGWGETVRRLQDGHPMAWLFLLVFTVIAAFAVINLFVGVIVEAVQAAPHGDLQREIHDVEQDIGEVQEAQESAALREERILAELRALRSEVAALRDKLADKP